MENKIKLVMKNQKSIKVFINGQLKKTINENEREISAEEIYNMLDYKRGDFYNITTENEEKIDEPVMSFFKELLDDICNRIKDLNITGVENEEQVEE